MERHELTPLIEALLFAAEQPLTVAVLTRAVDDDTVTRAEVKIVLDTLAESYEHQNRGFQLLRFGNTYQAVSNERFAPWVENLLKTRRKMRLSRAALETAAVIAYKQPISRVEVERVRGVDAGGVINTLLERDLVMIKGRDPGPGRPLLYGSTQTFLEYFSLSNLSDLPRLDELADLAGVDRDVWNDQERARFEKHGVDLETVPTPDTVLARGEEEAARPEGTDETVTQNPEVTDDAGTQAVAGGEPVVEPVDENAAVLSPDSDEAGPLDHEVEEPDAAQRSEPA